MPKKLNNEEFIKRSINIHGDKYDYSKVEYKHAHKKVCIICPEHGEFWQKANDHLKGCGCAKCRGFDKTTEEWVRLAKEKHGNKYDYTKSEYLGTSKKIKIICSIHGEFEQIAKEHLKYGCLECSRINCGDAQRFNKNTFIEKAQKVHKYQYDYSKSEYIGYDKCITITCPIHGDFITTPHIHLSGHYCSECANVRSFFENKLFEKIVEYYKDINIMKQYKANWLRYKHKMSLDIFIPDYNIAIEYQGSQHFKPNKFYGGINQFNKQIIRDELKFQQCKDNGITLLYFSYFDKEPENYKYKIFHKEDELLEEINKLIKK